MDKNDEVYVKLQRHLDSQAIGFPATRSGVELRILKHIFTPAEAEITLLLSYKPKSLQTIFAKAGNRVASLDSLEAVLDKIQKKGGIESKVKNGEKHYCCAPLVVGMYELQLGRLTPEFIKDFNEYISDRRFGVEFLSTALPQMRTIPVAKSITPQHHVSTFDEVATLLRQAEEPFAILECICRKKKALEGNPCRATDRKETCLAVGNMARMVLLGENGREISAEEAISIIEKNQEQGLVLQPSNTEMAEFICSCCGCCCGMLRTLKRIPKPVDYWATNFYAAVDPDRCEGCGDCEKSCQVSAIRVSENDRQAKVDPARCLGCGVCVPRCPVEAISLLKKPVETKPPLTREELHEIIMARKKSRLGKLRLTGKIIVDATRTGRIDLLKP